MTRNLEMPVQVGRIWLIKGKAEAWARACTQAGDLLDKMRHCVPFPFRSSGEEERDALSVAGDCCADLCSGTAGRGAGRTHKLRAGFSDYRCGHLLLVDGHGPRRICGSR